MVLHQHLRFERHLLSASKRTSIYYATPASCYVCLYLGKADIESYHEAALVGVDLAPGSYTLLACTEHPLSRVESLVRADGEHMRNCSAGVDQMVQRVRSHCRKHWFAALDKEDKVALYEPMPRDYMRKKGYL